MQFSVIPVRGTCAAQQGNKEVANDVALQATVNLYENVMYNTAEHLAVSLGVGPDTNRQFLSVQTSNTL